MVSSNGKEHVAMSHKQQLLARMRAMRDDLESIVAGYDGRLDEDMGDG